MPHNRATSAAIPRRRAWRAGLRANRGSTLVETAFSLSILLTLVIGIMEVGLAVYTYHFISNAAREGTRYAIVRGNTWTGSPWNVTGNCAPYSEAGCVASSTNIQDYVKSLVFPGVNASNISVTSTTYPPTPGSAACANYTDCNSYGDLVKVTVTYTFPFDIPFMPNKSLTMSSSSQMVISQ